MGDPFASSVTAVGSWFAQQVAAQGFKEAWQRFRRSRILDRVIEKTAVRFTPAIRSRVASIVRNSLKDWTSDPGFERLLRRLSERENIEEEQIVSDFLEKSGYPESTVPYSARKVVAFFLQCLEDELYNSEEGRALMMRRMEQMHGSMMSEMGDVKTGLEEIKQSVGSLSSEPAREAVSTYLRESQEWDSPRRLAKQDNVRRAIQEIEKRLQKIQEVEEEHPESGPLFRDHKQYLLLKSALHYTELGSEAEALRNYDKAKSNGFSRPEHRSLALKVLLNLQRAEEYREVLDEGEVENEDEAEINLLLLEKRWSELCAKLPDDPEEFRHAQLRVVAELAREDEELDAGGAVERLDHAEELAEDRRLQKVQLAVSTIDLLKYVVEERLEAPDLDRAELVESADRRAEVALSEYEEAEPDQGLYVIIQKARELYYLLNDEGRGSEMEELYEEVTDGLDARAEWEEALREGRITQAHHLFLQARDLLSNPAGPQTKKAISLLESGLHLAEEQKLRLVIAEQLVNIYLNQEDIESAEDVLAEVGDVSEARLVLLRFPVVRASDGSDEAIAYLSEKADDYPRHLYIRRALVQNLISRIADTANQTDTEEEVASLVEQVESRAEELQRILPTVQREVTVAKAHLAANDYNDAIKLVDKISDSGDLPLGAMRIRGEALISLQRWDEAGDQFAAIAEKTGNPQYAADASAYWLEEGQSEKAIEFLEPWNERSDAVLVGVNLALALIQDRPDDPNAGRRAFNLLAKACGENEVPTDELMQRMAKAASIAGKDNVARRYRRKSFPDQPVIARTEEDYEEIEKGSEGGMVAIQPAGREGLEAFVKRRRDYADNVNKLYGAELLSYGDLFRQSRRVLEAWTHWTETAWENHKSHPELGAIKAPWPTATRRQQDIAGNETRRGLLLGITALLTIWRLGKAETVLRSLENQGLSPHIRSDDLELLRRNVVSHVELIFDIATSPYREAIDVLRENGHLPSFEDDEIDTLWDLVPEHLHESLMASTPDYGLALSLDDAVYVTDPQESIDYIDRTKEPQIITSADLLGALVEGGLISEKKARSAERQNERFRGWKSQTDRKVPKKTVFSGFALIDWFDAELLTAFDEAWLEGEEGWPELRLGPFAVSHLREQADEQKVREQKRENMTTLYAELKELIKKGVVTVLPAQDRRVQQESESRLINLSSYATSLVEIADNEGLDVWSDDRVVGYFLWSFGHPLPMPEVKQEFMHFSEAHSEVGLITTEELLEQLSRSGSLKKEVAEEMGYELFKLGYRPLHFRLGLGHLLREYAYRGREQSPRYKPLLGAVESTLDGPKHGGTGDEFPSIDPVPLQRLLIASMLSELIASVWKHPGDRTLEERKALSDDLVGLVIDQLQELGRDIHGGLTSFWVRILAALSVGQPQVESGRVRHSSGEIDSNGSKISLEEFVEWFSTALIEQEPEERQVKVVRKIETYLVDFIFSYVLPAIENTDKDDAEKTVIRNEMVAGALAGMDIFLAPLFDTELFRHVDSLFRRAMGVLSQTAEEYKAKFTSKQTDEVIDEEEIERYAAGVFEKALDGDAAARQLIGGDLTIEGIWKRPVSEEVQKTSPELPEKMGVSVNVSLLTLLLREDAPSDLVDVVIHQLRLLDPSLARDIDALQVESDDKVISSRVDLALAILRSPFFHLQRDLSHGIAQLREMDTERLVDYLSPDSSGKQPTHSRVAATGDREYTASALSDFRMLYASSDTLFVSATREAEEVKLALEDQGEVTFEKISRSLIPVIESLSSPFEMASMLLNFLVMLEQIDDLGEASSGRSELNCEDWVNGFISKVLRDPMEEGGPSSQHGRIQECKEIHAAALRLGANVAGTPKHLSHWREELDDEDAVIRQWIIGSLLMASRLIPLVSGRYAAPEMTRDFLVGTVQDLGVAYGEPISTIDRFNPFLLGPHQLDHEVAAVLYILSIYVQHSENPGSVLDLNEIRATAERWKDHDAGKAGEIYQKQKEEAKDVDGLELPLLPSEAASHLLEVLDSIENGRG